MHSAPLLIYLVTEDWYFLSHRLHMARAARDAGFRVAVATRVDQGEARIRAEGFEVIPLNWRRGAAGPWELLRSIRQVHGVYRAFQPALVHHVAMKPVLVGGIAARLAGVPACVHALTGLGSTLIDGGGLTGRIIRRLLPRILNAGNALTLVQNADDRSEIAALGVKPTRFRIIRGSGVDLDHHTPLPTPGGPITFGFAGRMLADKGVRPLLQAFASLRADGIDARLLLAGDIDPENPTSLDAEEMRRAAAMPGVEWLGHLTDIRTLWARCHVAVLPSRREGLPKALLEAAAAGRALIATDVPGCREVAVAGRNALLVPPDNIGALAAALASLATDEALRRAFATESRRMVETDLSATAVAAQTLALYQHLHARAGR